MKKHLIRLADTLDECGLRREVNIIDYFISKAAEQHEEITLEFPRELHGSKMLQRGDIIVSASNGNITINVFSDLLGKKIRIYAENLARLFNADASKRVGQVSLEQIDDIVNSFKRYNNDYAITKEYWADNPNLIYPNTVDSIVKAIGSFVYHSSNFQINAELFIDALSDISIVYSDFYMEDYLNKEYDSTDYSSTIDEWRSNPENAEKERQQTKKVEDYAKRELRNFEEFERKRHIENAKKINPNIFDQTTEVVGYDE